MKTLSKLYTFILLWNVCIGFVVKHSTPRTPFSLSGFIAADSKDEILPPLEALTKKDNSIMIYGSIVSSTAKANGIKHFSKVSEISISDDTSKSVIAVGKGKEIYQDPGMSTEKYIVLAPLEAADQVLKNLDSSTHKHNNYYITFTGGEDLMVNEVLEAAEIINSKLSKENVKFASLCSPDFEADVCEIAIVVHEKDDDSFIFTNDGKWFTLKEDDFLP